MEQYAATDPAVCVEIVKAAAELLGCHRHDFIQSANQDEYLFFISGALLKFFTRFIEKSDTANDRKIREKVRERHDRMQRKETLRKKAKQEQKHMRLQEWRQNHGYPYLDLIDAFPTRADLSEGLMTVTSSFVASQGAAQEEEPMPSTSRAMETQEEGLSVLGSGDEIPDPPSEGAVMDVEEVTTAASDAAAPKTPSPIRHPTPVASPVHAPSPPPPPPPLPGPPRRRCSNRCSIWELVV